MGKQGPCCHCGVTSTPLWRNGPPDKPVLCNACGSRWRTKGTLANYTPLHARADPEFEDLGRISKVKSLPVYKKKEVNFQKRKRKNDNSTVEVAFLDHYQSFSGVIDDDTSNRSSSGSAISNSERSAQFGSGDASDLTGLAQSIVWDTMVPSRKRTCTGRQKQTSVEKLTQDLYTILHKQQSYFSGSSEDLIFETGKPLVSAETVHGSVLMRNPSSVTREEESEASSLTVDKKFYSQNEAYSYSPNHHVHSENHNKNLKFFDPASEAMKCMEPVNNRDDFQQEKLQFLENHYFLECDVDLSDVLNYEVFTGQLTDEEQHRLLEYLPPADATKLTDGLKQMFESREYMENLNFFRQVLAKGCLDISFENREDCRTLKELAPNFKQECGFPNSAKSSRFVNPRRSRDYQNKNFQDSKTTMKSLKVMMNMKASSEKKEHLEDEGSCFSPRSLFALPPERSMLENLNFAEESSDQDLLLDVRSNTSFPQAELLYPLNFRSQQASTSSSSAHQQLLLH